MEGAYGKPGSLISAEIFQERGSKGRVGPPGDYGLRGKPGCDGMSPNELVGPRGTTSLVGGPRVRVCADPPRARDEPGKSGDCQQCPKLLRPAY